MRTSRLVREQHANEYLFRRIGDGTLWTAAVRGIEMVRADVGDAGDQ